MNVHVRVLYVDEIAYGGTLDQVRCYADMLKDI